MSGPVMLVGGEPFSQPFDRFHLRWLRAGGDRRQAIGVREETVPLTPDAHRLSPTVVFLPTAAEIFPNDETADAAYRLGRMATLATVPVRTRADADDPDTAAGVAAADVVYLGDGDAGRLVRTLIGTAVGEAILAAWQGGATLIGAGAGAAGLCQSVPARPDDVPARVGEPFFRWFPGFAVVRGVTVLPRYNRTPDVWLRRLRDSVGDRRHAAQRAPAGENAPSLSPDAYRLTPVLGIDDLTALVWGGMGWAVEGYGRVVLVDGDGERSYGAGETVPVPPPAEG